MSGAHIEMNAAMNGLSSYSIRLDWDSYTRRMHIPPRVRNVNSISKMLSLSLSLALSNRNLENVRTNRVRIPLASRFLKIIQMLTKCFSTIPSLVRNHRSTRIPSFTRFSMTDISSICAKLYIHFDSLI